MDNLVILLIIITIITIIYYIYNILKLKRAQNYDVAKRVSTILNYFCQILTNTSEKYKEDNKQYKDLIETNSVKKILNSTDRENYNGY